MDNPQVIILGVSAITEELIVGLQIGETMTVICLPPSAAVPEPASLMESVMASLLDRPERERGAVVNQDADRLDRLPVRTCLKPVPDFERNLAALKQAPQPQRAIAQYKGRQHQPGFRRR